MKPAKGDNKRRQHTTENLYGSKNVNESQAISELDDDAPASAGDQAFDLDPPRDDECYIARDGGESNARGNGRGVF